MLPVIALVGRPNVGKSTLFNVLTRTRDALVVDLPGVTRDRKYGHSYDEEHPFIVIDTGGIDDSADPVVELMQSQTKQAIGEANLVLFLVDAKVGVTVADHEVAKYLRNQNKNIVLVANKIDGVDVDVALADFYQLGLGDPVPIAASHRRGTHQLLALIPKPEGSQDTVSQDEDPSAALSKHIKIALVGRPNVGKSTLTNRILGEERVVVLDQPGTTRDSIYVPFTRHGADYTLIDTAGIRRKGRINEVLEKFSVVKSLQAVDDSDVSIVLIDAQEGVTDQDLHLIGFVLDAGRALVIGINKWDHLTEDQRTKVKKQMDLKLGFVSEFVDLHFISALHGTGVGDLFKSVLAGYRSATHPFNTSELTTLLGRAIEDHQPPLVRGRRVKLKYVHIGGHQPPVFVIHGNLSDALPDSYKRYLVNYFRRHYKLVGTPLRLHFKSSDNPFAGRRNKLTPRQLFKKKRLMKHLKKKSK